MLLFVAALAVAFTLLTVRSEINRRNDRNELRAACLQNQNIALGNRRILVQLIAQADEKSIPALTRALVSVPVFHCQ